MGVLGGQSGRQQRQTRQLLSEAVMEFTGNSPLLATPCFLQRLLEPLALRDVNPDAPLQPTWNLEPRTDIEPFDRFARTILGGQLPHAAVVIVLAPPRLLQHESAVF